MLYLQQPLTDGMGTVGHGVIKRLHILLCTHTYTHISAHWVCTHSPFTKTLTESLNPHCCEKSPLLLPTPHPNRLSRRKEQKHPVCPFKKYILMILVLLKRPYLCPEGCLHFSATLHFPHFNKFKLFLGHGGTAGSIAISKLKAPRFDPEVCLLSVWSCQMVDKLL